MREDTGSRYDVSRVKFRYFVVVSRHLFRGRDLSLSETGVRWRVHTFESIQIMLDPWRQIERLLPIWHLDDSTKTDDFLNYTIYISFSVGFDISWNVYDNKNPYFRIRHSSKRIVFRLTRYVTKLRFWTVNIIISEFFTGVSPRQQTFFSRNTYFPLPNFKTQKLYNVGLFYVSCDFMELKKLGEVFLN